MHETFIVQATDDEDGVCVVLAELHHGVVRPLGQLPARNALHISLQVLAYSLPHDQTLDQS